MRKNQNVLYSVTVNVTKKDARKIANVITITAAAIVISILYVNGKI